MMIGPPIDNREVLFEPVVTDYGTTIILSFICFIVAYRLWLNHKGIWPYRFFLVTGIIGLLTMPWFSSFTESVIGAYPTIDKEGALFFFNKDVHTSWILNPTGAMDNQGLQLIGVHIGHLLLVECWNWFVEPIVAFNIQAILNPILNTLAVWWWLDDSQSEAHKKPEWMSLLAALIVGAQLHVFRDIHWYTIEKSMLFPIFIYWGTLIRSTRDNSYSKWLAPLYFCAIFINFYWGILLAVLTATYVLIDVNFRKRQCLIGVFSSGCVGLFMAWIQTILQSEKRRFAQPDEFEVRAALDSFELLTLNWNRMGFLNPLNGVLVVAFGWLVIRRRVRWQQLVLGLTFILLSCGPQFNDATSNPVYMMFAKIPGMWRFAKPEIFLFVPYALIVRSVFKHEKYPIPSTFIWLLAGIWFLVGLYSSSAFPYQTLFVE